MRIWKWLLPLSLLLPAPLHAQQDVILKYVCGSSATGQNIYCPVGSGANGTAGLPTTGGGGGGTVTQGPPNAGGAANSWNVQGAGVAGTPAGGVVSIQGVAGGTAQPTTISSALPAGSAIIGKVGIDQTTPGTTNGVQVNAALPAGTNNIGLVQPTPGTTGGWTTSTITAANSTNATNLKASAGTLGHISGYSAAAVPTWVTFYNNSGTPTCGTAIVYEVLIPVNSTSGGGFIEDIPAGLNFSTGIAYCITTAIGGTGAVAATSIVVNFGYK